MLAEFALTPWIFDEASQPDLDAWREQLYDLAITMFPRNRASPVIVSNLAGGEWVEAAARVIKGIRDHRAKARCLSLLNQIKDRHTLVNRPACFNHVRYNELAWTKEAMDSAKEECIDRIVTSNSKDALPTETASAARPIADVQSDDFWLDIPPPSPKMKIGDQVQLLRKLCKHSQFLCLITPYIQGCDDDETRFAQAVIKSTFTRPARFPAVDVEVHTKGPKDRGKPWINNVKTSLRECLKPGQELKLFFWPNLRERLVIAGSKTQVSSGNFQRAPRWGVHMGHVARPRDDKKDPDDQTVWTLCPAEDLRHWFDKYCGEGVSGFFDPPHKVHG